MLNFSIKITPEMQLFKGLAVYNNCLILLVYVKFDQHKEIKIQNITISSNFFKYYFYWVIMFKNSIAYLIYFFNNSLFFYLYILYT